MNVLNRVFHFVVAKKIVVWDDYEIQFEVGSAYTSAFAQVLLHQTSSQKIRSGIFAAAYLESTKSTSISVSCFAIKILHSIQISFDLLFIH